MQNRLVVVVGIVAAALALSALFGAWWGFAYGSPSGGITITIGFAPFGATTTTQGCDNPNTVCQVIPEVNATSYPYPPNIAGVFLVAATLTTLAALSGVSMVAVMVVSASRPRFRRWGILLGIAAFVLALAALAYVTSRLQGALSQDGLFADSFPGFWGSMALGGAGSTTVTWGAGWAWYAVLAAALLFLIGSIVLFRARARPATPTTPRAAQHP